MGMFFEMPAHQIWSCHVAQKVNFENCLFRSNSTSHKISSGEALTSKVISQNPHGGGGGGGVGPHSSAFGVNS